MLNFMLVTNEKLLKCPVLLAVLAPMLADGSILSPSRILLTSSVSQWLEMYHVSGKSRVQIPHRGDLDLFFFRTVFVALQSLTRVESFSNRRRILKYGGIISFTTFLCREGYKIRQESIVSSLGLLWSMRRRGWWTKSVVQHES